MQRPGRIGGDKLHLHLAPSPALRCRRMRPAPGCARRPPVAVIRQEEIDKAGTCHLGAGQQRIRGQRRANQLGEFARLALRRFGQRQRDVARQVAVALVAGCDQSGPPRDTSGQHPWAISTGQQVLKQKRFTVTVSVAFIGMNPRSLNATTGVGGYGDPARSRPGPAPAGVPRCRRRQRGR